ncbi:MAG: hypothetical protein EOO27_35940 [Comamonadaceae bacterium]|nr:MAG: hypothetical protein EOO27_35940 [Comamonadaceae bacterium]
MRQRNVTRWISSKVKPVRVGMYQVQFLDRVGLFYSRWDGKRWFVSKYTAFLADQAAIEIASIQFMRWRGRKLPPRRLRKLMRGKG